MEISIHLLPELAHSRLEPVLSLGDLEVSVLSYFPLELHLFSAPNLFILYRFLWHDELSLPSPDLLLLEESQENST